MSWSSSWVKYAVQDKHTPEPCESLRITWNLKRKTPTVQAPGYSSFSQDSTAVRQDPGPAPNLPAHFTAPGFSAGPSQDAAVPASPDIQTPARFSAPRPTSLSHLSLYMTNTPLPGQTGPGISGFLTSPFPVSLSHWPVLGIRLLQCLVNLFPHFYSAATNLK